MLVSNQILLFGDIIEIQVKHPVPKLNCNIIVLKKQRKRNRGRSFPFENIKKHLTSECFLIKQISKARDIFI